MEGHRARGVSIGEVGRGIERRRGAPVHLYQYTNTGESSYLPVPRFEAWKNKQGMVAHPERFGFASLQQTNPLVSIAKRPESIPYHT